MTKLQRQVLEFHRQFDHPVADSPTIPSDDRVRFRARFIVEECLEFITAVLDVEHAQGSPRAAIDDVFKTLTFVIDHAPIKVDLDLAVDALADIDYVVEGIRDEFGINGEPIADEVHRANMTKGICPACGGCGKFISRGPDDPGPIDGKCQICKGTGRATIKRPDGKMLKPPGWTPPDISRELEKQRRGIGSLSSVRSYDALKEAALALPPMTPQQKSEMKLDWAYGNLAIDGKASRSAFKVIATTTIDDGLGWSEEQFDAWAADKKWDAP
jgi:predicted HAD superfamily Cof-like phosphohydrolase